MTGCVPSTKAYERHVDHMLREEPQFEFVRADYVAHEQIVCPMISGLVGLPRLVLLYLDTGLAHGRELFVAQD
jgi:hypothetical protein